MDKLWLIIQREYLSRVRKKTFILATILTPLAIGAIAIGAGVISSVGGRPEMKVLVADESGHFQASNPESESYQFVFSDEPVESLKSRYADEGYDLLLHVPPFADLTKTAHQAFFYSVKKPSLGTISALESMIGKSIMDYKIQASNVGREVYESFKTDVELEGGLKAEGGEQSRESGKLAIVIGTALGGLMGFMMYMVIFIFGGMVMRSVMEEKMNRIVEVMISSVKPFQLMLGKILGVGAVGLTQLAIWLILIPVVILVVQLTMGIEPMQPDAVGSMNGIPQEELENFGMAQILFEFRQMNWGLILPAFVLFFLGGYFIYSSLFAAIGSAISDDMGESQSLMLPIMLPVILAFIMLPAILENPNGSLAVFGSMFPLFSPVLMPVRLAFDPPLWQVLVSVLLLLGTAVFFVWLSGRIYRVGILMYGKKVNFKEIGKWLFYKV